MISLPEVIFAILTAAAVFGIVLVIRNGGDRRREAERERVLGLNTEDSGVITLASSGPITLTPPPQPTGPSAKIDRWFDTAVSRSGLDASPAGVVALSSLLGLLFAAGLYFWKDQIGLALFGLALGVAIPIIVVSIMQGRYKQKLQNQLPDCFYLLAGSLRSGLTLEQAIDLYAERGNKPLADEFKHTSGLLKLGASVPTALKSSAQRIDLLDFNLLVSTVGLYMQTGGNMALLLDRLAASVRDRNTFRGQFKASTAQARAVAVAMACAVPLFLVVYALFEPEHIGVFFTSANGWAIAVGCVILEVIGVIWVWRLFKVDY
jgi:tight adherence protein B